jgi:aminopeptidase N
MKSVKKNRMLKGYKRLIFRGVVWVMMIGLNTVAMAAKIDVKHYHIAITHLDFSAKQITANTTIKLEMNELNDTVDLDLWGLTVDSVTGWDVKSFHQFGEKLNILLANKKSKGDEINLRVYYRGAPKTDASWGGFYFSGNYAFNLGVGFSSDPHNLGRVWFPCRDNFTDKATYSFAVTVPAGYKALCNGNNDSVIGQTWYWSLKEIIPTYLASVAVAPYVIHHAEHNGTDLTLASLPSDSLKMLGSFENLTRAIDAFEARYGKHRFSRAGFNAVPFNAGAMEHATNIAYPLNSVDGTLNSETLLAHELAHHWWGNNVTCSDQTYMWLNEGWASYSERIFLEWVYGKERYREDISANHRSVLHYAHLRDGKAWPVSGVDHQRTYGMHVYDKGADVIHSLRGYMGDSAFFKACAAFMEAYEFGNAETNDLKLVFKRFTSANLDFFFRYWIEQPGSTAFNIFEWTSTPESDGRQKNSLRIKQNLRMAPELYQGVPYEVTMMDAGWKKEVHTLIFGGLDSVYTVYSQIKPVYMALDMDEKLSDAITDRFEVIRDTGTVDFGDALCKVQVSGLKDSALLRIEHFWTAADAYYQKIPGLKLSRNRYWKVDGILDPTFKASAVLEYNARITGTSYASGYLDTDLGILNEDSLVLMYRPFPFSAWQIETDVIRNGGTPLDRKGQMTIRNLKKGEYAWAIYDTRALGDNALVDVPLRIFPNPSSSEINFQFPELTGSACLEIVDVRGVAVKKIALKSGSDEYSLKQHALRPGIYWAGISVKDQAYQPIKFVVQ